MDGIKIIPQDIYNIINEISLAHWIICDGSKLSNGGLILCTDNFSVEDVIRLINVFYIKWDIPVRLHFYDKKPRIYIPRKVVEKNYILLY